jgi:hypothetical protein
LTPSCPCALCVCDGAQRSATSPTFQACEPSASACACACACSRASSSAACASA